MTRTPTRRAIVESKTSPAEPALWWLLQAALFLVSLVTVTGRDVFRLPKLLLLEGAAIILFGACAIVSILMPRRGILQRLQKHRWPLAIAIAAVTWTAVTTATSTQRTLSLESLRWVACCAAFFLVSVALAGTRPLRSVAVALIPPLINAVVAIIQRLGVWNPFVFPEGLDVRLRVTGYLGNPNDLGGYLLLPCLAAIVLSVMHHGAIRAISAAAALVMIAGIAVTETLTAFIALAAALFTLVFQLSRRAALGLAAAGVTAIVIAGALHLPVAERARRVVTDAMAGRLNLATSGRLQGFAAAGAMFRDHPLLGVGPGCFSYWYVPYNLWLSGRNPEFLNIDAKFHDAHNDHLQLLATTGVPGYAILLLALGYLGTRSLKPAADQRRRFAGLFAAPVTVAIGTLTLASFPLELAAPISLMLYFAALVVAWSRVS